MYGKGLKGLSIATVATITVAMALVFFYAPMDADQGFIQKIFYLHVPLAIVALVGFIVGRPATAATTPAPTSRSTSRSSSAPPS
jgi:ABC-type transport system involved in cytochrome c biogenesis permease subunit